MHTDETADKQNDVESITITVNYRGQQYERTITGAIDDIDVAIEAAARYMRRYIADALDSVPVRWCPDCGQRIELTGSTSFICGQSRHTYDVADLLESPPEPDDQPAIEKASDALAAFRNADVADWQWLRNRRRAAGVSQHEIAAAIGVNWNTVADWEFGRRTPPPSDFGAYLQYIENAERGARESASPVVTIDDLIMIFGEYITPYVRSGEPPLSAIMSGLLAFRKHKTMR